MDKIQNQQIIQSIERVLEKNIKDVTDTDLFLVESIAVSGDEENNYNIDLNDLPFLPNIRFMNISDAIVENKDLEQLKNIPRISFNRCNFENDSFLSTLNSLISLDIFSCYITDYSFLKDLSNLEEINISRPKTDVPIEISSLSCNKLKSLQLNFCQIEDLSGIENLNIEELDLIGSSLPNNYEECIHNLPMLKTLFIEAEYPYENGENQNVDIRNDKYGLSLEDEEV